MPKRLPRYDTPRAPDSGIECGRVGVGGMPPTPTGETGCIQKIFLICMYISDVAERRWSVGNPQGFQHGTFKGA